MHLRDIWKTPGIYLNVLETSSRYHVDIQAANVGNSSKIIQLAGAIIQSPDPAYQRLFVAGSHAYRPDFSLAPREEKVIRLATVCMDEKLKDPELGLVLGVSLEMGPSMLIKEAARWRQRYCPSGDEEEYFLGPHGDLSDLKSLELVAYGKLDHLEMAS